MKRAATLVMWAALSCAPLGGCGGPGPDGNADPALVGGWRIDSETFYLDGSSAGDSIVPVTRELGLGGNGQWSFGSSSGGWSVAPATAADWARWDVSAYGPTRKLVLAGWNGDVADGPIEEDGSGVSFVWVIYAVTDPEPGTVWIKLGRAD